LKSTGGNATVTTNTFAMGASGAISDGSGTTTIKPASAESISVDGAGGALAITSTELGQITAGTLVVGDSTLGGGLTVAGSANLGTLGYNLTLNNAGNITANGQTTTIAGKTLTFNGTGTSSVDPGAVNGNAGSVSVTAGSGGINLSGAININNAGTANGSIALSTTGTIGGAGLQTAGTLTTTSGAGTSSFNTASPILTVNTSGTVNASQSVNSVTLDTNSTTSGTLNLSAATGLNITVGAGQTAQYDGGVSLTTAGTGTATINGTLKSSGGNATVTTNTFAMGAGGAITDTTGTTTIKPASAES